MIYNSWKVCYYWLNSYVRISDITIFHPYKNFVLEIYSPNIVGYLLFISSSLSHVASSTTWFFQSNLTIKFLYFSTACLLFLIFELVATDMIYQNLVSVARNLAPEMSFGCISSILKHGRHGEHWLMMEEVLVCRLHLQSSQGSQWSNVEWTQLSFLTKPHYSLHWCNIQKYLIPSIKFKLPSSSIRWALLLPLNS